MKKGLSAFVSVGCLVAAGTAIAGIEAGTGVNGSLHDMNIIIGTNADSMGRVCVFCHTPHHAVVKNGSADLPLWNHDITPDSQFVPYTWATPNNSNEGAFGITDPLAGPSRLCMSCHDGSIAIDEHGPTFAQSGVKLIDSVNTGIDYTGRANLTKDLSNTHPIGFDYNDIAAFRNSKALNGSGTKTGSGSNAQFAEGTEIVLSSYGYASDITVHNSQDQGYNLVTRAENGKRIADNLYGGNIMTCATCHEVHNKENATQTPFITTGGKPIALTLKNGSVTLTAPNYFLYAKEDKSLICLSCHIK